MHKCFSIHLKRLFHYKALRKRLKIWTTCSIKMSLEGQTLQALSCQAILVQILTTFVRDLDTAISISSAPLLSLGEPNLISMGSSSCCWLFRLFATAWMVRIHSSLTQKKTYITPHPYQIWPKDAKCCQILFRQTICTKKSVYMEKHWFRR